MRVTTLLFLVCLLPQVSAEGDENEVPWDRLEFKFFELSIPSPGNPYAKAVEETWAQKGTPEQWVSVVLGGTLEGCVWGAFYGLLFGLYALVNLVVGAVTGCLAAACGGADSDGDSGAWAGVFACMMGIIAFVCAVLVVVCLLGFVVALLFILLSVLALGVFVVVLVLAVLLVGALWTALLCCLALALWGVIRCVKAVVKRKLSQQGGRWNAVVATLEIVSTYIAEATLRIFMLYADLCIIVASVRGYGLIDEACDRRTRLDDVCGYHRLVLDWVAEAFPFLEGMLDTVLGAVNVEELYDFSYELHGRVVDRLDWQCYGFQVLPVMMGLGGGMMALCVMIRFDFTARLAEGLTKTLKTGSYWGPVLRLVKELTTKLVELMMCAGSAAFVLVFEFSSITACPYHGDVIVAALCFVSLVVLVLATFPYIAIVVVGQGTWRGCWSFADLLLALAGLWHPKGAWVERYQQTLQPDEKGNAVATIEASDEPLFLASYLHISSLVFASAVLVFPLGALPGMWLQSAHEGHPMILPVRVEVPSKQQLPKIELTKLGLVEKGLAVARFGFLLLVVFSGSARVRIGCLVTCVLLVLVMAALSIVTARTRRSMEQPQATTGKSISQPEASEAKPREDAKPPAITAGPTASGTVVLDVAGASPEPAGEKAEEQHTLASPGDATVDAEEVATATPPVAGVGEEVAPDVLTDKMGHTAEHGHPVEVEAGAVEISIPLDAGTSAAMKGDEMQAAGDAHDDVPHGSLRVHISEPGTVSV